MTMLKLALPPDADGYQSTDGTEWLQTKLDGGRSRSTFHEWKNSWEIVPSCGAKLVAASDSDAVMTVELRCSIPSQSTWVSASTMKV